MQAGTASPLTDEKLSDRKSHRGPTAARSSAVLAGVQEPRQGGGHPTSKGSGPPPGGAGGQGPGRWVSRLHSRTQGVLGGPTLQQTPARPERVLMQRPAQQGAGWQGQPGQVYVQSR